MMHSTIQIIMLDQASNALFWYTQWIYPYNQVVKSYGTFNSDEWTAARYRYGMLYGTSKIMAKKANTGTQLIQQSTLCLWLIYCLVYGSYLVFKWLKWCDTVQLSWLCCCFTYTILLVHRPMSVIYHTKWPFTYLKF